MADSIFLKFSQRVARWMRCAEFGISFVSSHGDLVLVEISLHELEARKSRHR